MLIVNQEQVRSLLPVGECITLMERALASLAREEAVQPLRTLLRLPNGAGILGAMPAYIGDPASLAVKLITVFHGNEGTQLDSHQGAVLYFSSDTGELLAVIDASSITAIRTAAVSAVATRLLARDNAATLCLLGSGVQADTHLSAMRAVRPINQVRVWSRSPASAEKFATRNRGDGSLPIRVCASAADAVRDADIICTVTSSREPVVQSSWIAAGTHLNVVGASVRTSREVDSATMQRSRLFVDRRESTVNEAGDYLIPLAEGVITDQHIVAELGEILIGTHPGRQSSDEVTLFKSLGLAVEDAAAAAHVYQSAVASHTGLSVDLGGRKTF